MLSNAAHSSESITPNQPDTSTYIPTHFRKPNMKTASLVAAFATFGLSFGAVQLSIFTEPNCGGTKSETTVNNDSCDSHITGLGSFIINSVTGVSTTSTLTFYADGSACVGSSVYQTDVGPKGYPKGCQNTNGGAGSIGLDIAAPRKFYIFLLVAILEWLIRCLSFSGRPDVTRFLPANVRNSERQTSHSHARDNGTGVSCRYSISEENHIRRCLAFCEYHVPLPCFTLSPFRALTQFPCTTSS